MKTESGRSPEIVDGGVATDVARGIFGAVWLAVRLPVLAFLTIIEPVVRIVLGGAAFLGTLVAFVLEFSGTPNFPFWFMISMSVGCMLLLFAYYALLRLFS